MALDLQALATEINTDPNGYGYAAWVALGSDGGVADLLNVVRITIDIKRTDISCRELYEAISVADYTALGANPNAGALSQERRYLAWLTGLVALSRVRLVNEDGTDTPVMANLDAMFGSATGSYARIHALALRKGSRAEQLFGADTFITGEQVGWALRGGAPT
jgi:hypothetical protein